jgi:hypothetical protein
MCLEKKRDGKRREREKREIGRKYWHLESVALPSSLSHGGAGLDPFHCYIEPPAKTC